MDTKIIRCYFCGSIDLKNVDKNFYPDKPRSYIFPVCGHIFLDLDPSLSQDIELRDFNKEEKRIIGTVIKNEYERRDRKPFNERRTIKDLKQIIDQYRPLDTLEKIDNALLNLERSSKFAGEKMKVDLPRDYRYYHCLNQNELHYILYSLCEEGFVDAIDPSNPHNGLSIATKGYQRLRELKKHKD